MHSEGLYVDPTRGLVVGCSPITVESLGERTPAFLPSPGVLIVSRDPRQGSQGACFAPVLHAFSSQTGSIVEHPQMELMNAVGLSSLLRVSHHECDAVKTFLLACCYSSVPSNQGEAVGGYQVGQYTWAVGANMTAMPTLIMGVERMKAWAQASVYTLQAATRLSSKPLACLSTSTPQRIVGRTRWRPFWSARREKQSWTSSQTVFAPTSRTGCAVVKSCATDCRTGSHAEVLC